MLMELSPIKMVSVKSRPSSKNAGKISFFLPFWLNLAVDVRLTRDTTTTCLQLLSKMKMVIFVFVVVIAACTCFVVAWDCVSQFVCVACPVSIARMTRGASVTVAVFFNCFLQVLYCVICCWSWHSCHGRSEAWIAQSAWGFHLEDLLVHGCVCCAWIEVIDTSVTMIVIAGWVLLWYSQCPHNALVAFVNNAALWLQGWLPRTSLLLLRSSICKCFGTSQWWHSLHPLQSMMALIALIAIGNGNGVVACCCLSQLCLVLMLASCSQLGFLMF